MFFQILASRAPLHYQDAVSLPVWEYKDSHYKDEMVVR